VTNPPSLFSHLSQATVARLKITNKLLKHKAHSSKAFRGTLVAIHQGGEFRRIGDRVVSRRGFFCVAKGAPMKRTLTMTFLLVFSGALVDAQAPAKPAKQYRIDVSESR
jgi:hypothetical protein